MGVFSIQMLHHLHPLLFISFLCAHLCHSVSVSTADDLINLFNDAAGNILKTDIELLNDIDFSGSSLTFPLGVFSSDTCVEYSGVFQGNGHSIKGLKMNNTNNGVYKGAGLFCSLNDATVENLVIDSSCSFTGYYAGALSVSVNGPLTVKNTKNKAAVNGMWNVGGFIGSVKPLKQSAVISFEDCINDGNATGSYSYVGGFVGYMSFNINMIMSISNSTNNGNIHGNGYVGGFFGDMSSNTIMTVTISNSTNNGNAHGNEYAGGFVGHISSSMSSSITLGTINSANNGSVSATRSMACGFICVDSNEHNNVNTTILNAINKGNVNANMSAYGMTNIITVGRNLVSMGEITGSSSSYTFWESSADVHLFFGLNGKCSRCGAGATLFQHNTSTGFYEVVESGEHVDDLLNDEAVNQHFDMVWSSELELVDKLNMTVNVSGLWCASYNVESGTPLNQVGNLSDYFNDDEWCVADGDSKPMIAFKPTRLVTKNMSIVVGKGMSVSVGAPINKSVRMVVGERLEDLALFFKFSLDDFIVVENETEQVFNKSSMIERDTVLKLCHNVAISGALSKTLIVEHGTKLGKMRDLKNYFQSSFVIYYENNKTSVLTSDTLILNDIFITIKEVSHQEIVIKFDEKEDITVEEVENAIKDLVELPNDENVWIEVISEGDNSFIVSVKQTGTEEIDIADSLKDCILSNL